MKARLGDIIEFSTPRGTAYAQFSHSNKEFGELLRVLPGLHDKRPNDFSDLVAQREIFYVFYPLQAMIQEGLVAVVGHDEVPAESQPFPLFKAAGWRDPETGRVHDWWLWDGNREWRVGSLSQEQASLPIRAIMGHDLLVDRLAKGWHPRDAK